MSKKCPRNCGVYSDLDRKCPVCDSFLMKIKDSNPGNSTAAQPQSATPVVQQPTTPFVKPPPTTPVTTNTYAKPKPKPKPTPKSTSTSTPTAPVQLKTETVDPNDCYPFSTLPNLRGCVRSLRTGEVKKSTLAKVFESIRTGMPFIVSKTVTSFQLFKQDNYGRDTTATTVIVRGDIIDGDLYEGNIVRVWGNAPRGGNFRANRVYNETSNSVLRIGGGIPSVVLWVMVASVAGLIIMLALNITSVSQALRQIFVYVFIGIALIIALKLQWRRFIYGGRRGRRWF